MIVKNTVDQGQPTTDSYFAPAERTDIDELAREIEIVGNNPLVSGLLFSIDGLLAVLDEHRQIVFYNFLVISNKMVLDRILSRQQ